MIEHSRGHNGQLAGSQDFSAFFEVFLSGRWWPLDARHNVPRIGRVLMARGRDAVDVALTTTFGPHRLVSFKVITEEVTRDMGVPPMQTAA